MKKNINKHFQMLVIIACTFFFFFNSGYMYSQGVKDTIYVSTFGQKINIIDEVVKSNDHTLYKITNAKQRDILKSSLYNFAKMENAGDIMMFNLFSRQLDVRNFDEEICYVLVSNLTREIEIKQPFHFRDEKDLFFPVIKKEPSESQYVYIRIYVVKINDDIYDKFLLIEDEAIKLEPVILK